MEGWSDSHTGWTMVHPPITQVDQIKNLDGTIMCFTNMFTIIEIWDDVYVVITMTAYVGTCVSLFYTYY